MHKLLKGFLSYVRGDYSPSVTLLIAFVLGCLVLPALFQPLVYWFSGKAGTEVQYLQMLQDGTLSQAMLHFLLVLFPFYIMFSIAIFNSTKKAGRCMKFSYRLVTILFMLVYLFNLFAFSVA